MRTDKLTIPQARSISLAAGQDIKTLLFTYGVLDQSTSQHRPPTHNDPLYHEWVREFRKIYNPSILWRPQHEVTEEEQFATVTAQ